MEILHLEVVKTNIITDGMLALLVEQVDKLLLDLPVTNELEVYIFKIFLLFIVF